MRRHTPVALLILSAPLAAQSVIAVHRPLPVLLPQIFGETARFVGDINGDGVADYGASCDEPDNKVFLFDGATSGLRLTLLGLDNGGIMGHDFVGADFDGDGLSDVAMGGYASDELEIFSGFDGSLLATGFGPSRMLDVVGDLNGDGVPDVVGGTATEYLSAPLGVRVYSGADGATLANHLGSMSTHTGRDVLGPGDLNGDGVPEYLYSMPESLNGRVRAIDGATHTIAWSMSSPVSGDSLGAALAAIGDVDLDGLPDIAASSLSSSTPHVLVLSGADGALINTIPADPSLQYAALAGPGDLSGDGRPDLLVGAHYLATSHVDLRDPVTDALIWTVPGNGLPGFGNSLDAGPDLNGDGATEILVGHLAPNFQSGSATLLSSVDLPWSELGNWLAGDGMPPLLRGDGSLLAGSPTHLSISHAPPSGPVLLVVGGATLYAGLKGGVLVPAPSLLVDLAADAGGQVLLQTPWPPGVPPGTTIVLQAWWPDASASKGWAATNGLLAETP